MSRARPTTSRAATARPLLLALARAYPNATCELVWRTPFELLVATILSAQCTDKRVNLVTPALFARFPTAAAMAIADQAELEALVRTTGFFRAKANNISLTSRALVERHNGEPPRSMAELVALPGVARKTANVVMGVAYGLAEGIVVDTHVLRTSLRLGLSSHDNPIKTERDLLEVVPAAQRIDTSHRLIAHGRAVCKAQRPLCDACVLRPHCSYVATVNKTSGSKNK